MPVGAVIRKSPPGHVSYPANQPPADVSYPGIIHDMSVVGEERVDADTSPDADDIVRRIHVSIARIEDYIDAVKYHRAMQARDWLPYNGEAKVVADWRVNRKCTLDVDARKSWGGLYDKHGEPLDIVRQAP